MGQLPQQQSQSVLPSQDSATGRSLKSAGYVLFVFISGLIAVILQVPGVPETIMNYTYAHLNDVLVGVGVPMVVGSGITSFIYNMVFRGDVRAYRA